MKPDCLGYAGRRELDWVGGRRAIAYEWLPRVAVASVCYYGYYMRETVLKVARIGNSRGVRIPAATLARYRIGDSVVLEERPDGIFLRPVGPFARRLGWAETARAIVAAGEPWGDWDGALGDGLESVPWIGASTPPKVKGRGRVRK